MSPYNMLNILKAPYKYTKLTFTFNNYFNKIVFKITTLQICINIAKDPLAISTVKITSRALSVTSAITFHSFLIRSQTSAALMLLLQNR